MNTAASDPVRSSRLARQIASAWLEGAPPDAHAALAEHPELAEDRSALAELAYEEFCLRKQAGETIDVEAFCASFPAIESFLHRILAADLYLAEGTSFLPLPSEAPGRVDWPLPGDTVAGCLLLRELGRGAFARVYLAREHTTGERPVALKLTQLGGNEARLLGRLHHDHVVPILWAGKLPELGLHVVCMPFQGSATWADLIDHLYPRRGVRPPERSTGIIEAVEAAAHPDDPTPDMTLPGPELGKLSFAEGVRRLACVLLDGLEFLHGRGLYHCDLKPSNLLLTPQCRPLILDFNLSHTEGKAVGFVGGTYVYMAPELLRAHATKEPQPAATARADLYSLGVILYELLTGRLPYGAVPHDLPLAEVPSWLLGQMKQEIIPLARLNPGVPVAMASAIESCLALEPQARPASAAVLKRLLQSPGQKRWKAALAGGVLLGLAVAAVGMTPMRQAPLPEGVSASNNVMVLLRQAGNESLARGQALLLAGQPEKARPHLREAAERFRKLAEHHRAAEQPAPGAWHDQLQQAQALVLLDAPEDARPLARRADDLFRVDAARLVCSALAPLPLGATAVWSPLQPEAPGLILACRSHCATRMGDHVAALALGEQALQAGGRSAALLNNLGYSALQQGKLPLARDYLREARRRAPTSGTILFNSCLVSHRLLLRSRSAIPAWLLADIDRAVELLQTQGGESAELYRLASQILARAVIEQRSGPDAGQRPELRRRENQLMEYVRRGCVLGLDGAALLRDPILQAALGEQFPREQLEAFRQQSAPTMVVQTYLIDPLGSRRP
ncbi:MAG: serine/threonine-protein kinase [Gemmataceae bacterium]